MKRDMNEVCWDASALGIHMEECEEGGIRQKGRLTQGSYKRSLSLSYGDFEAGATLQGCSVSRQRGQVFVSLHRPVIGMGCVRRHVTLSEAVSEHERYCSEGSSCVFSASDVPSSWEMGASAPKWVSG